MKFTIDLSSLLSLRLQVTSSSVGINPIQGQYDSIKIEHANMMLATYDRVNPNEPVVMTHAQTFDGRQVAVCLVLMTCSLEVSAIVHSNMSSLLYW